MKKLANFTILFLLFCVANIHGAIASSAPAKPENKDSFFLRELLFAHQIIADSKQSGSVDRQIPGSIVSISEKKYQVVSFMFVDTKDNLGEETFDEYAKKNNLYSMRSQTISPIEGITFEVFDSSKAHAQEGVYFYISLKILKTESE